MAVPNSNFDQITAIVNDFFMPKFADLVHDAHPVLKMLHAKGTTPRGGAAIRQPFLYQATQDGAYTDYQKGDTTAEDQATAFEYPWKLYRQRVVISVPEMNRASGPEAKFQLLKGKMQLAQTAIRDAIATDMWSITGGMDTSAEVNSLVNILSDGTYPSTLGSATSGGIDKSVTTAAQGITQDAVDEPYGQMEEMETLWYNIIDGNISPNLICSHPGSMRQHQKEVTVTNKVERFVNTNEMLSGFTTITFQGTPWVADRHITETNAANTVGLYMLNLDYLDLVSHKNENFRFGGFQTPDDQNVRIGWIYWMGNFVSSDPSRSGYIYS